MRYKTTTKRFWSQFMFIFFKSSERVFPENYGTQEGEGERESAVGGRRAYTEHLTTL
jgi:hypothetical protein